MNIVMLITTIVQIINNPNKSNSDLHDEGPAAVALEEAVQRAAQVDAPPRRIASL